MWSCGDYSNDLTGFTINNLPNTTINISKEYATNGDYGIKLVRNAVEQYYTQIQFNYTINNEDYSKTAIFTIDMNNQLNGDCSIQLKIDSHIFYTNVPQKSNGSFSISSEIPNGINSLSMAIAINGQRTGTLYTDNLKLTIL